MLSAQSPITELLREWRSGRPDALPPLAEVVYADLRAIALRRLRGSTASTLDPSSLVNEAFMRLWEADTDWRDRAHFFALAALYMRNVLVDHALAAQAEKRGGGMQPITLTIDIEASAEQQTGMTELDEALRRLEHADARAGKVIELTYFGGLKREEIAYVLETSVPTIDRDLRFGRAWLRRELAT